MNVFRASLLFVLSPLLAWGAAPTDSLLEQAVEKWLGERDHWAFTQKAVEYPKGERRERLERYDPSLPGNARWTLLALNGRSPTAEEREAWEKRKFKKNPRRIDTPLGEFFDFRDARVIGQEDNTVQYELPLRREKQWLVETEKVRVVVTVNKETRALEHISASMREPVKVLLGLARVTEGKLDLSFMADGDESTSGPDGVTPTGSATVTVSKLGERAEFTWTDFKRVTATPRNVSLRFP